MSGTVDRGFEARCQASRERLAGVVDGLADADMGRDAGGWTVGTNLAHLAFWDRFLLLRWREAMASGRGLPIGLGSPLFDLVNDALAPEWARLDAAAVRALALEAATELDAYLAALPDELVGAALAGGVPRNVDRSAHRGDHLDAIEAALVRAG